MANSKERYARIWLDSKGKMRDAWSRFTKGWTDIENYEKNIRQMDRIIGKRELDTLLQSNVCEVVFVRRRPERAPERPEVRRMLCSNCIPMLASQNGKTSLNFRFPKTSRRMDERRHDICVVWDIIMHDYRNISLSTPESPSVSIEKGTPSYPTCYLRQVIPADDTFWKYFNDVLLKMSPQQKMQFMDSR